MEVDTEPMATAAEGAGIPATGGEHLLTVLFGLWMTVGLFLDGYFHQNLDSEGESFLTPWHGVFYAGFAASAFWLLAMSRRRAPGSADWSLRFLPPGYDGARLGIVLFALGGIGDAAWHTAFGVERGVDALLSPTHLVLFVGLVLILTAPLRAMRVAPRSSPWILVGSLTSATALVGFFLNFAWGLGIAALTRVPYDPVTEAGETEVIAGVASMLVTTTVLFVAARLLSSAGSIPAGAFTTLFGLVAILVSVAFDEDLEGVVAAVLAGAALDVLLRAAPSRSWRVAATFGAVSAGMWLVYLGLLSGLDGIEWQAEIWLGGVVLNGLAAYLIAGTIASSAVPTTATVSPGVPS
jgi:hypothetical protein